MRRVFGLLLMLLLATVLLYLSRFWIWRLWPGPGLFGWNQLPPQGDLVTRWLRGTPLAPFALLVWAAGSFLVLTWVQKFYDRLTAPKSGD